MNNIYITKCDTQKSNECITILKSKSSNPIVKYNGLFLSSQYSPIIEAKRLAERYYKKNYAHILFGIGSFYLAKELLKRMDESDFLLIIEPSPMLFEKIKNLKALAPLIDHPRVFFIVGFDEQQIEEEIQFVIHKMYMAQVTFIISPNYDNLYPQYIDMLQEKIKNNVYMSIVNFNTIRSFSEIWQKNLLWNIKELWKALPFRKFQNKLTCPVIIASSGPSLTKQLHLLKSVKENNSALIIAAGSTINPLLKAGIKPHFIVVIDGSEANWNHFKHIQYDDIPLFYSLIVHKDIPKKHSGIKVVFHQDDEKLRNWIDTIIGEELGHVKGGASVANFCLFIAKSISTGPIAFIGQDLAYTDHLSHAEGNINKKSLNPEDCLKDKKYTRIKGYYGGTVLSDYSFVNMKKSFEDMVLTFRNQGDLRSIFNCTEGGAFIEGFLNVPFQQFIDTYCTQNYLADFQHMFPSYEPNLMQKQFIEHNMKIEKENIVKIVEISKKATEIIKRAEETCDQIDDSILSELETIDNELNKRLGSNFLFYIMNPILFRVNYLYQESENESREESTKRILNKSKALYAGILKAAQSTIEIFEEVLSSDGMK